MLCTWSNNSGFLLKCWTLILPQMVFIWAVLVCPVLNLHVSKPNKIKKWDPAKNREQIRGPNQEEALAPMTIVASILSGLNFFTFWTLLARQDQPAKPFCAGQVGLDAPIHDTWERQPIDPTVYRHSESSHHVSGCERACSCAPACHCHVYSMCKCHMLAVIPYTEPRENVAMIDAFCLSCLARLHHPGALGTRFPSLRIG